MKTWEELTPDELVQLRELARKTDQNLVDLATQLVDLQTALMRASQLVAQMKVDMRLMLWLRRMQDAKAPPALEQK